jgi:hypothetical protein
VAEALETLDGSTAEEGGESMWVLNGCGVSLAPSITGTGACDGDVFILGFGDLWVWQSPVLEFRYSERAGPAFIDMTLFGYVAVRLIQPRGLSAIRHT